MLQMFMKITSNWEQSGENAKYAEIQIKPRFPEEYVENTE